MYASFANRIDTETLRRVHNLADVIASDLGRPVRRGRLYTWHCPFHSGDNSPSFTVYPDGHYHCFGCNAHGDVITWTMERRGLTFIEACRELGSTHVSDVRSTSAVLSHSGAEADIRDSLLPAAPSQPWQEAATRIVMECECNLWDRHSEASAEARQYLTSRGLDEAILQDFLIGYNPQECRNRNLGLWVPEGITIPLWHSKTNTLFGVNVRLSGDARDRWKAATGRDAKYLMASGSKRAPIGLESIVGKRYAFVLEGEFDTLLVLQTLRAMGQKAKQAGAFTLGSASSQDVDRWLLLYPELLSPARFLVAVDSDAAGDRAATHWAEITPGRARLWKPPAPCKDVTELWQKHGYEGVRWWILEGLRRYQINKVANGI